MAHSIRLGLLLLVTGEDIGTFVENGFIYEAGRKKAGVLGEGGGCSRALKNIWAGGHVIALVA